MRFPLRSLTLAGFLTTALLILTVTPVQAQGYGGGYGYGQVYGGGGYGGYNPGYGGGYRGYNPGYGGYRQGYDGGGYGGGGYGGGVPTYNYYGNGGHDAVPHMHTTETPIGTFGWYGLGAHDFRPHNHTETPYGIQSHHDDEPFTRTQSYAPPTPYIYRPW